MDYLKIIAITTTITAVIIVVGCLHFVRGSMVHNRLGLQVCWKYGWTLDHTLMNTDDYLEQPMRVAMLDDGVIVALIRCGVVHIHSADDLVDELQKTGQTVNM